MDLVFFLSFLELEWSPASVQQKQAPIRPNTQARSDPFVSELARIGDADCLVVVDRKEGRKELARTRARARGFRVVAFSFLYLSSRSDVVHPTSC